MNPQWICLRLTALELLFQTLYEFSLMLPFFFFFFFLNHFQFPGNHAEPFVAVSLKLSHQAANDNSKKKKCLQRQSCSWIPANYTCSNYFFFFFHPTFNGYLLTLGGNTGPSAVSAQTGERKDSVFTWTLHLWELQVGHEWRVKDQNLVLMVFQGFLYSFAPRIWFEKVLDLLWPHTTLRCCFVNSINQKCWSYISLWWFSHVELLPLRRF